MNENLQPEQLASDESFQDYVINKDPEAVKYWQNWIKDHPEAREAVEVAESMVETFQFNLPSYPQKRSLDLQQLQIDLMSQEDSESKPSFMGSSPIRIWKIAAAILLICGMGYTFWWIGANGDELTIKDRELSIIKHEISKGQKKTIQLLDGTIVNLNSESTLRYEENEAEGLREVFLTGEAFFEVTRDPLRPFIVNAGSTKTIVLGTSFNCKAYPHEKEVSVALVHGSVEVRNQSGLSEILTPNQMITIDEDEKFTVEAFDPEKITGWKDGILYFEELDFNEIRYKLERWYNVEIEVDGKIEGKAFSGKFYNESLDQVLNGIGFSLHFNHKINGRKVLIKPNE